MAPFGFPFRTHFSHLFNLGRKRRIYENERFVHETIIFEGPRSQHRPKKRPNLDQKVDQISTLICISEPTCPGLQRARASRAQTHSLPVISSSITILSIRTLLPKRSVNLVKILRYEFSEVPEVQARMIVVVVVCTRSRGVHW